MKKLKLNGVTFERLNHTEMLFVIGGRSGTIIGCRVWEGVCYQDVEWHDTGEVDCEVERPIDDCRPTICDNV